MYISHIRNHTSENKIFNHVESDLIESAFVHKPTALHISSARESRLNTNNTLALHNKHSSRPVAGYTTILENLIEISTAKGNSESLKLLPLSFHNLTSPPNFAKGLVYAKTFHHHLLHCEKLALEETTMTPILPFSTLMRSRFATIST